MDVGRVFDLGNDAFEDARRKFLFVRCIDREATPASDGGNDERSEEGKRIGNLRKCLLRTCVVRPTLCCEVVEEEEGVGKAV